MDNESLMELAKARAQLDTKALKRTIKEFYRLLSPELSGEQLQAAHESFLISLEQMAQHLNKTVRLRQVTEIEISGYQTEESSIESTSAETTERIAGLAERLKQAQTERARRIEYDSLSKTINKLPNRTKASESNQKLRDDLNLLESEQLKYSSTWSNRREAFDQIVNSLASMSEAIKDEKQQQDLRRALDEDDNEPPTVSAAPASPKAAAAVEDDGKKSGEASEEEGEERNSNKPTKQKSVGLNPDAQEFEMPDAEQGDVTAAAAADEMEEGEEETSAEREENRPEAEFSMQGVEVELEEGEEGEA